MLEGNMNTNDYSYYEFAKLSMSTDDLFLKTQFVIAIEETMWRYRFFIQQTMFTESLLNNET